MAMPKMTDENLFSVDAELVKNLARNVPKDFNGYLKQVERNLEQTPYRQRSQPLYEIRDMAGILNDNPTDELIVDIETFVRDTWLRYEALNRSIDYCLTSAPMEQLRAFA